MEEWWHSRGMGGLSRGLSVFREELGGLVEGWVAKLAALYFEPRHHSKFIMGDISKGLAKRTKMCKKWHTIKVIHVF